VVVVVTIIVFFFLVPDGLLNGDIAFEGGVPGQLFEE
jgi:hypothetical protein